MNTRAAHADSGDRSGEYRIDDLAARTGTTVRNIRAYQDRGLLPPPRRVGRVGIYTDQHVARLGLVTELLERGYSLANIAELVAAWEQGRDIGELLGLEAALTAPWSDEATVTISVEELLGRFEAPIDGTTLVEADQLGVLELDGDVVHVNSPRLLEAAAALVQAGVPLGAVVAHGAALRTDVERVAERFVTLFVDQIVEPLGDPLPAEEIPRLTDLVNQLRPMAERVVVAELARAMQHAIRSHLGDTIDRSSA